MPVGARTTTFFLVIDRKYLKKVDFPVPALPLRKTFSEVFSKTSKSSRSSFVSLIVGFVGVFGGCSVATGCFILVQNIALKRQVNDRSFPLLEYSLFLPHAMVL